MQMMDALVALVARVPARVQAKLLAAFLAIAMLLIMMGAVGLQLLSGVNQREQGRGHAVELGRRALPTMQLFRARCGSLTNSDTTWIGCSS